MSVSGHKIIIMLDHTIGQMDRVDGKLAGVDLTPTAEDEIARLLTMGTQITLVVPEDLTRSEQTAIRRDVPGVMVRRATVRPVAAGLGRPAGKVVVAADRVVRAGALARGFRVVPHLAAARWVVQGERLVFARIIASERPGPSVEGLLPYRIEPHGSRWMILGLITDAYLLQVVQEGADVTLLPFDFARGDCAILRPDKGQSVVAAAWQGGQVLSAIGNDLLVALYGADEAAEDAALSSHRGHGLIELLPPAPDLLARAPDGAAFDSWSQALAANLAGAGLASFDTPVAGHLAAPLPDAAAVKAAADRYSGFAPLDASGAIVSRHVRHPDNLRVVNALKAELAAMGYATYTHDFVYAGQTLRNVIADMPGTGYFKIDPEVLKKLIGLLRPYRKPWPWPEIQGRLKATLGVTGLNQLRQGLGEPFQQRLEELVWIYRSVPYRKLGTQLPGIGAQVVVLGAHLDSTAGYTPGYNASTDAAPGVDDNASGMAACLTVARALRFCAGALRHTVRFSFFNAEEVGLVGSKAFASHLKATGTPVKAAICTDMIGYNSDANLIFEVHAGATNTAVRDLSVSVAEAVADAAASLGVLQSAQVYRGISASGGPDRTLWDPAIDRSDHASFPQQGYAAVVISEDYFANQAAEPLKDPNPHYHTQNDTLIDTTYAAAIASAVVNAVLDLAR